MAKPENNETPKVDAKTTKVEANQKDVAAGSEASASDTVETPSEPVEAAVKKINRKATKTVAAKKKTTAKRAKAGKAEAPRAAAKEKTMTNFDMNKWFGGYDMPAADKVEEMMAKAGQQGEAWIAKSRAGTEELAQIAKANAEAMVESARIAAAGAKSIGTEMIEDSRTQFEAASDNLRRLAEAKNPQDYIAIQSELAKSQFDQMVAESSKLTEKMVKLMGEVMQPVSNRASLNAEKVKDLMA